MKRKKLLSTAVAGVLVAAQMVMPVMAADGGTVQVPIDTTNVVIRVEVPTSLAISVNQFEKGDAGSQITSTSFTLKNKSEIPVWVTVDSKLTKAAGFDLEGKRDDAKTSTEAAGKAWVGVVAQYQVEATAGTIISSDYAKTGEQFADLDEDSENVDVFEQDTTTKTTATATQEFYLAKPTPGSSSLTYTSFIPKADGVADIAYARFFELDELTLTGGSEQDDLDAAIAAGDVYSMATGDKGVTNKSMTRIPKDGSETYSASNNLTYYTVATTATAEGSLDKSKFYVFASDVLGGETSFRYIGSLSDSKATWTSGASGDFEKMEIKYDIKGLTDTKYQAAVTDQSLIYGYKKKAPANVAPSITTTTYTLTAGTALDIPVNLGSGDKAATGVASVKWTEGNNEELLGTHVTYANGKLTVTAACATTLKNGLVPATFVVKFNNSDGTEVTLTMN